MPNCNIRGNVIKCLDEYESTMWDARDATPNPLLYTDAMYLYNFLNGDLLEDDLPRLEDFLCEHFFPYERPVPTPYFAPKRKYGCSCSREFHMQAVSYALIYQRKWFPAPVKKVPKFSDYPKMANSKYCKRTLYGYYGITDYLAGYVVTFYQPRKELELSLIAANLPEICHPWKDMHKLNDYGYHKYYPHDV